MRGGRVTLNTIVSPPSEFEHVEKGDALYGKPPTQILSMKYSSHIKLINRSISNHIRLYSFDLDQQWS